MSVPLTSHCYARLLCQTIVALIHRAIDLRGLIIVVKATYETRSFSREFALYGSTSSIGLKLYEINIELFFFINKNAIILIMDARPNGAKRTKNRISHKYFTHFNIFSFLLN